MSKSFFRHHSFGSKTWSKNCLEINLPLLHMLNPAKGRVDFEDSWLIKSSFTTKDEMKLVS
jgi:hypothetical protein